MSAAPVIVATPEQLAEIVEAAVRRALASQPAPAPVAPTPAGYLKVSAAAERFSVAPETIRDWIRSGRLPRLRAGKEWRVRVADIEALLARQPDAELDVETAVANMLRRSRR